MISEGSCDIEDCSNDAENSALHHSNKLHFETYWNNYNYVNILQYYCTFDQINSVLMRIRDFFEKHKHF